MGETVEHSAENSLDLSLDTSAEESVRLPMRHSVRETNKIPAETCMSTHSVSTSDEIDQSIHPRTNFRDQLIARLARERELLARRNEDAAHIAAQCIPNAELIFNDDWKNDDSTYNTPTKPASTSNRPMSPVADRVIRFPQVADGVLHRPPVTERVIRLPSFPIFDDNNPRSPHQLHLKAERKKRQRTQKEKWMAANEAKKV